MHAVRSYLKLTCENELHTFSNTKVSAAKNHCENYMKVRPPLVRHLLRNRLLNVSKATIIHGAIYRPDSFVLMLRHCGI